MNRNSKKIVSQDIKFLKEMLFNIDEVVNDKESIKQLKLMINDWMFELENFLVLKKSLNKKQLTDLIEKIKGEIELDENPKEYSEKTILESIKALIEQKN